MGDTRRFLRRLRRELPIWQERGWVSGKNSQAILHYVECQRSSTPFLPILAILGAILLVTGLVTYVAANWQGLGRLIKLLILVSSVYISYLAGGLALSKAPRLAEGCFLVGLGAFGAAIMLVAQIYHIESHNPSAALLLWISGGLLSSYLLRSHSCLILTMLLGMLWSLLETHDAPVRIHFWYLLLWLALVPALYRWRWSGAWDVAVIGLVVWSLSVWSAVVRGEYPYTHEHGTFYLIQLYFFAYSSLFFAATLAPSAGFFRPGRLYGALGALFSLYLLTFASFQSGWDQPRTPASAPYSYLTLSAFALWLGLGIRCWQRIDSQQRWQRAGYPVYGLLLFSALALALLVNLSMTGAHGSWLALAFNLLFFASTVWLVFAGIRTNERSLVNIGFVFFALGLISRYFDTFWTLLDRSLFFIFGGMLLLAGAWFLEARRRAINARLTRGQDR